MKMPLPKMKPKQKFVLFAVVSFVIIATIMMYRAFSSDSQLVEVGGVRVDPRAASDTTDVKDTKATDNTEANRLLNQIKEDERKKEFAVDGENSVIDKPVLTPTIGEIVDESTIEDNKSNQILSLDQLVQEIAKEKKPTPEPVKEVNVVDKFTEKKRISDEAVNINFDRQSYMSGLVNISTQLPSYNSDSIFEVKPNAANIRSYQNNINTNTSEKPNSGIFPSQDTNVVSDTLNKRDQLLDRMLGSNTDDNIADNNNTNKNAESTKDVDYPYNKTMTVGDTIYAINRLPINTDGVPVIQLTIVSSGDMNNAVLSGTFTKMRDSVVLRFTTYSKNGKSYPINAMAIDPETWESMIADDVDNHYWERYGGVILASLVKGYSQSIQDVSVSDTNVGQRETRQGLDSFSDRLMVGFGEAGAALAPVFLENAGRDSTVFVYKDRPVAVLFLDNFKVPISD